MRLSALLAPTLREVPSEAEVVSHRLMLRAGLMRKAAGGIYTYLPLGYRVLKKIMAIVREEMDAAGCQELMLPIIQPAELWHQTGRWAEYGDEMFRLKDRHGRAFCLGPTHEEIITDLVRSEVRSYRQLPLILYQIQNKYRDEIRPRFGVIRGREFIMKDAYSFDRDRAGLDVSYQKMFEAYERIFRRVGLETRAVLADPGAIGGDDTHEFMVLADTGEAEVVYCTECQYAANVEKAAARVLPAQDPGDGKSVAVPPFQEIPTPGVRTIAELEAFLGLPATQMIKTLIYKADDRVVAVLVRGDREVNELKLARALGASSVEPADAATVEKATGAPVGFAGPVGLDGLMIVADLEVPFIHDGITGANKADTHLRHVAYGRDYRADLVADVRFVVAGDLCPECGGTLASARGIEVGQVFKLGTKYSAALGATYLDETGQERLIEMGCYGIGISRTMAAIIEQHHDERGIRWPISVAPYHVDLIVINPADTAQLQAAESLYRQLWDAGVEVVLDDRDERAGVKFNDADLIGFPFRVVVGPRTLSEGKVEVKARVQDEARILPFDEAVRYLQEQIAPHVERGGALVESRSSHPGV
jgi:prolyl-tRNA synthetase, family II